MYGKYRILPASGLILGLCLFLTSCAGQSQMPFEQRMDALKGRLTYAQAVARWGPPSRLWQRRGGKTAHWRLVLDVYVQHLTLEFDRQERMRSWREDLWCCIPKRP